MPAAVSLGTLITRAQALADMQNANFVSSGIWTYWANTAAQDLYDKLATADPERYMATTTFTMPATNSGVQALPSDFYRLLRVDCYYGPTATPQFYILRKFNLLEEDVFQFPTYTVLAGPAYRYRLRADAIVIEPLPSSNTNFRLFYVPVMPQMNVASDTVDGVNGWEQMIVLDMAINALLKENATDPSFLIQERKKWQDKIQSLAEQRDSSFAETTVDTTRGPWPYGGFGGPLGGGGT